jgi:hypothetical protein
MLLPSMIIHEQASHQQQKTSTRGGGGGTSRQPTQHSAITNRRAARLHMPMAEELIYYVPLAKGCAMV